MIDAITKQPLKVLAVPEAGPMVYLSATQLDTVVKLFRDHGLRCWPSPEVLSINGAPATGYVVLSRNEKAETAQAILDAMP
jgi:hypothetical protein